jgi:hypothetical protein
VLLAAAACGGTPGVHSAPQAAAGTRCRAADLQALFRGFQGAGGSMTGAVVITNTGSRPCWLDGAPQSVSLLDDGGGTISVRSRPLDLPVGAGAVQLKPGTPLPTFGAPPARGSAWFVVTWSNWCGDASPSVQSLLIVLPAGGSLSAPLDAASGSWGDGRTVPHCDNARAGSTVTISRFQAPAT